MIFSRATTARPRCDRTSESPRGKLHGIRRWLAVATVGTVGLLGMGMATAPVAHAHDATSFHPAEGSYVGLTGDHAYLVVCDLDPDGHYVYARTYRNSVVQNPLYDHNGAGGSCGWYEARAGSLDSFNVCVQDEGCGRPVYWWEF